MTDQGFPVYAIAAGQRVRIGTAYKEGDGFSVSIGAVVIGATPDAPSTQRRAVSGDSVAPGGARLPNFGKSAGQPVHGASLRDLTFYQSVLAKNVEDPSKARWREQNQATLDAIEAEIARQGGGDYTPPRSDGPVDDADIPF